MKITCGSCHRLLQVEDWLADNVARCPRCDQVIRIPPAHSPAGATAVVLTVEEAADLLRRRAAEATEPAPSDSAPSAEVASAAPAAGGPKTEPLPAALRRPAQPAAAKSESATPLRGQPAIGPHAEPPRHRTRPLTDVLAPKAEADDEALAPPTTAGTTARRRFAIGPVITAAFLLGLAIGAVAGWLIGRTGPGSAGSEGSEGSSGGQPATPALQPAGGPSGPASQLQLQGEPAGPAEGEPAFAMPVRTSQPWPSRQPAVTTIALDGPPTFTRQLAAIGDGYPANNFYFPAPPGQVYLRVQARLLWNADEAVTLKLGGGGADCWLVTDEARVYEPLGATLAELDPGGQSGPADPEASVTLDLSNLRADVDVLFRVPESLPATRLRVTGARFVDAPAAILTPPAPPSIDSLKGTWTPVPFQSHRTQYDAGAAVMQTLVGLGRSHTLMIARTGPAGLAADVDNGKLSGTLNADATPGYYRGELAGGSATADVTARPFDGGRMLVLYFGPGPYMQFVYQRPPTATPQ